MSFLRRLAPYLVYLALTAPFAAKDFHIDDTLFVKMARQVRVDPLRPLDFTMVWDGRRTHQREHSNPPLQGYILAAASLPFGEGEVPLHLAMLAFGCLALWATGRLARRFGVSALAAQLLVATSPALVVSSQTVMPDVTLFGLLAAGVALGLDALHAGGSRRVIAGGMLLGLAAVDRYNALGLPLLLLLYAFAAKLPLRRAALLLLVSLALPFSWNVLTLATDGAPHLLATGAASRPGSDAYDVGSRVLVTIFFWGGAVVMPPFFALPLVVRRRQLIAALTAGLVVALISCVWWTARDGKYAGSMVLYPLLFVCGAYALARAVRHAARPLLAWRSRSRADVDAAFLAFWILGLCLPPLLYVHTAVKYLVPALPAIVILFLRWLPARFEGLLRVAVVGNAILALAMSYGDSVGASVNSRTGREIVAPLVLRGHAVWARLDWGMALYAEAAGARPYHEGADVKVGDLLIVARQTPPASLPDALRSRVRLVSQERLRTSYPVAVMNRALDAGFYSNYWGFLPFAIHPGGFELDEITVYEVLPAASGVGSTDKPRSIRSPDG